MSSKDRPYNRQKVCRDHRRVGCAGQRFLQYAEDTKGLPGVFAFVVQERHHQEGIWGRLYDGNPPRQEGRDTVCDLRVLGVFHLRAGGVRALCGFFGGGGKKSLRGQGRLPKEYEGMVQWIWTEDAGRGADRRVQSELCYAGGG